MTSKEKKYIHDKIQEMDSVYISLQQKLDKCHPDVMYIKGHRDAYLNLYNKETF